MIYLLFHMTEALRLKKGQNFVDRHLNNQVSSAYPQDTFPFAKVPFEEKYKGEGSNFCTMVVTRLLCTWIFMLG